MAIEKVELKDALNALVTNTNIDKVTGVLGGVPSNIAKNDLASVVAGFIGSYKNNGNLTDADTATETGVYRIYGKVNNSPLNYGVLSVDNTGTYIQQIASSAGVENPAVYLRTRNSDTWSAWQRLDSFGYNTLAELAGGVAENNPRTINVLKGKQLYRIGLCGVWGYGGFMASIGDGSNNDSSLVSVSYRLMGENAKVTYSKTGSVSLGVHIYKKIEDGVLNVYLYSSVSDDTYNPIIGLSSRDISLIGSNLDLSSYELVGSL